MPLTFRSNTAIHYGEGQKLTSSQAGKPTTVTIRFLDDEIMEGRVSRISLEQPNLELDLRDDTGNNESALVPLPSIKRITLAAGAPTPAEREHEGRKVGRIIAPSLARPATLSDAFSSFVTQPRFFRRSFVIGSL